MSLYLPDGCTQDEIDRHINGPEPVAALDEFEEFVSSGDSVDETGFCHRCNDYPCRCGRENEECPF